MVQRLNFHKYQFQSTGFYTQINQRTTLKQNTKQLNNFCGAVVELSPFVPESAGLKSPVFKMFIKKTKKNLFLKHLLK